MVFWLLGMAIAGVLTSGGVLRWALRGRKIDDHPLCRKCGFDLTGKPADSTRCPECGSDVSAPGGVRVGNRVRRAGVAWFAGALLASIIAGGVGAGYALTRIADLAPRFPTRVLGWIAIYGDDAGRTAAYDELSARATVNKTLSPGDLDAFADAALDRQADLATTWDGKWGNLFNRAHDAGLIDVGRWQRFQLNCVTVAPHVRDSFRPGDDLPVQLQFDARAIGSVQGYGAVARADVSAELVLPGGTTVPVQVRSPAGAVGSIFWTPSQFLGLADGEALRSLSPGDRTLPLRVTIAYRDLPVFNPQQLPFTRDPSRVFSREVAGTRTMQVPLALHVSASPPAFELTIESSRNDAIRDSIKTASIYIVGPNVAGLTIPVSPEPELTLAYEVQLFSGDRPLSKPAYFVRRDTRNYNGQYVPYDQPTPGFLCKLLRVDLTGPLPDKVQVRLTPSARAAARTMDVQHYAPVPIVLPDVPILFRGPTSRATR